VPVDPAPPVLAPAVEDPATAPGLLPAPAAEPKPATPVVEAASASADATLAPIAPSTPAPPTPLAPTVPRTVDVSDSSAPSIASDADETNGPARPPASPIAAILASGAPAALMPAVAGSDAAARRLLLSAPARRGLGHNATSGADPAPKPPPVTQGGGQGPAPSGPPGSASAGAASAAAGGLSSAQWGVVIVALLALAGRELRRHRLRLTLSGPSGFAPLLQRPG
jgi:hypothetical protein